MANCPHCNVKLKPWNIRAECPACGVNIPNYRWEERLEEDAVRSEEAFAKLRRHIANFKSALVGNRLRIARLVCIFLPLVLVVLPYARIELYLPFYEAVKHESLLQVILLLVNNFDPRAILAMVTGKHMGAVLLPLVLCVLLVVGSILSGVVNFLLTLLRAPKLGYVGNVVCCVLSLLMVASSGIAYSVFLTRLAQTSLAGALPTSTWGPCLFVGIVLYGLNAGLNIAAGSGLRTERRLAEMPQNREAMPQTA